MNKILEMNNLIDMLNYHTELYNEGNPTISDKEWDEMYFRLQLLENETGIYLPGSPTQNIIYNTIDKLNKIKHNHPMLSLDKTKDWNAFIQYFSNKSVVGMLKLDGLTCSLRYNNGKLISAETRGNGIEGEDILHNALVIRNIPKKIDYNEELVIDGEIICTYKDFEPFANDYANPRNFASGSIRLLDSKECARRSLRFIAWYVEIGSKETVIDSFNFIQSLGFTVTPWTSSWDWDAKDFLIERAKEEGYPIDGLVGRFNDLTYGKSLGATGHHSRAAYAFKFYDEEYETKLLGIEWSMSRTGQITPIALFEKVDTGDSIIERASLHNISVMKQLLSTPYQGQTITIFKANDIIPQVSSGSIPESRADIEGLILEIPTICPICGGRLDVECEVDTEVLKCNNIDCQGQLVNRLNHFCSKKGLDIKGLSKTTLNKLIDWGWLAQPADIYKLKDYRKEWVDKSGFGEKSVDNILEAIEISRRPKLDSFISALGIPLIGKTISKDLIKYITTYEDFRNKAKSKWDFTQIDGIAYEKASAIWNFNFDEADAVNEYMLEYIIEEEIKMTKDSNINDKTFCITGRLTQFKNRNELVSMIEKYGGKVTSSVSKNTNYLINNDIDSTSTKNASAKKLGIPILTEGQFLELIS